MPILLDIMDHEVIGPAIRKGLEQGRQEGRLEGRQEGRLEGRQQGRLEGRQEGRLEGRQEGRLEGRQEGRQEAFREACQNLVRRLLEKRFGEIPVWAEARLAELSAAELEELAVRIFDTSHLEELF